LAQPTRWNVSNPTKHSRVGLTGLDKLEAIHNAALVADEEQPSTMFGFLVLPLLICNLLPKLYTSTHDPPALNGYPVVFEVSAGQHLSGMSGERAEFLEVLLSSETVVVSPARPV
jgi:hypothetical protein